MYYRRLLTSASGRETASGRNGIALEEWPGGPGVSAHVRGGRDNEEEAGRQRREEVAMERRFRLLNGLVLWAHTLEHIFLALASYVSASEIVTLHTATFQACVACTVVHMAGTMLLFRFLHIHAPAR
jgi:hypothetical protein